jgi:CHAT domain-containing protein
MARRRSRGQWIGRGVAVAIAAIGLGLGGNLGAGAGLRGAAIAQAPPLAEADKAFGDGDYERAAQAYGQWFATARGTEDGYDLALIEWGQALLKLGRYGEALPVLDRSLARGEGAPVLGRKGLALFHLGRYGEAIAAIDQALAQWEQLRAGQREDLDRVTLLEQQGYLYRLLVRSLLAAGRTDEALVQVERGRARSLVELLTRHATGEPLNSAPPTLDRLRAIARSLNATLVSYGAVGREIKILGDEPEDDSLWGIWVIQPQGQVTFRRLDLGDRPNADGQLPSLIPLVTAARQEVTFPLPQTTYSALRQLYDRLIGPIESLLPEGDGQPVIFALQGALYLAPWAALQAPDGSFLIDRAPIATVPSLQTLEVAVALQRRPSRATQPGLVVGNPVSMPSLPTGPNRALEPLEPLKGAEAEAQEVARMLGGQVLLNEAATKGAVLAAMPSQRVLHFATHGLLDRDEELNEYGLPRNESAPTAREGGVRVTPGGVIIGGNVSINGTPARVALAQERVVRPLMPGTIALAPAGGDDGLLRSLEIARVPLAAELAVLSACDTGRGRITGDGVVGMARSFMAAGVPTVIASLWQVPDEATRSLMVAFYRHWLAGAPKATALRRAMLETRQTYPHPRYWSAFLVVGTPE